MEFWPGGFGEFVAAIDTGAKHVNKKQQMRWNRTTVQSFLEVRTAMLDDNLRDAVAIAIGGSGRSTTTRFCRRPPDHRPTILHARPLGRRRLSRRAAYPARRVADEATAEARVPPALDLACVVACVGRSCCVSEVRPQRHNYNFVFMRLLIVVVSAGLSRLRLS